MRETRIGYLDRDAVRAGGKQDMRTLLCAAGLLAASLVCATPVMAAAGGKVFDAALMVGNEGVGKVRFTRDGSALVYEQLLPYTHRPDYSRDFLADRDRSTVRVRALSPGREAGPASKENDRTWILDESPDGTYLAFGWFDEAGIARVGIRNTATGEEARRNERISLYSLCASECPVWISGRHLVVFSQDDSDQAAYTAITSSNFRRLVALTEQSWQGKTASVHVVGSGTLQRAGETRDAPHRIWLIDAQTGHATLLDEGIQSHSASPVASAGTGKVAYMKRVGEFYKGKHAPLLNIAGSRDDTRLVVYDLDRGVRELVLCEGCSANPRTLRWSPGGRWLYFTARRLAGSQLEFHQYIYDTKRGTLSPFRVSGVDFRIEADQANAVWSAPLLWLDEQRVAVRVSRPGAGPLEDQDFRWYLADRSGKVLKELTGQLPRGGDPHAFRDPVAVHRGALLLEADGDLWKVPQNGAPENLTAGIPGRLRPWCERPHADRPSLSCDVLQQQFIEYPQQGLGDRQPGVVVLSVLDADGSATGSYVMLDVDSGETRRLQLPTRDSTLMTASWAAKAGAFLRRTEDGDGLFVVHHDGTIAQVHGFNLHLAGVRAPEATRLTRREPGEAEDRHDWLLLPPGYTPGQRLPLLVFFYPDYEYGLELSGNDLRTVSYLNMSIPASRGYAVLLASMRISPMGGASAPLQEMHEQLIHAAENAVSLGYADAGRWALMGHSYGGYGTMSVITRTDRFRAAISSAGISNIPGLYADTRLATGSTRYVPDDPLPAAEGPQFRMGSPPWVDPQRYVDNSPLFFADRIRTPLMLVHGDLDYVDVDQSAQMITAMLRQKKDAVFVRYWGEYHVPQSPANIIDFWDRVIGFLDRYIGPGAAPAETAPTAH